MRCFLILAALLLVAGALGGCGVGPAGRYGLPGDATWLGEPADALYVVVVYWHLGCPYCAAELTSLAQNYGVLRGMDVEVIAANVGDDEAAVSAVGLPFPTVVGLSPGDVAASGVPFTVVFRRGKVVWEVVGAITAADLVGFING